MWPPDHPPQRLLPFVPHIRPPHCSTSSYVSEKDATQCCDTTRSIVIIAIVRVVDPNNEDNETCGVTSLLGTLLGDKQT